MKPTPVHVPILETGKIGPLDDGATWEVQVLLTWAQTTTLFTGKLMMGLNLGLFEFAQTPLNYAHRMPRETTRTNYCVQ